MDYDFSLILSVLMIILGLGAVLCLFIVRCKGTWKIVIAYATFLCGCILLLLTCLADILPMKDLEECSIYVESSSGKRACKVIQIDTVHYGIKTHGDTLYLYHIEE